MGLIGRSRFGWGRYYDFTQADYSEVLPSKSEDVTFMQSVASLDSCGSIS